MSIKDKVGIGIAIALMAAAPVLLYKLTYSVHESRAYWAMDCIEKATDNTYSRTQPGTITECYEAAKKLYPDPR